MGAWDRAPLKINANGPKTPQTNLLSDSTSPFSNLKCSDDGEDFSNFICVNSLCNHGSETSTSDNGYKQVKTRFRVTKFIQY